ncbi:MAG: vitamin B12 dependent-methionine synthase activation domain-containing protein [Prolixibacteraceae bacterium]
MNIKEFSISFEDLALCRQDIFKMMKMEDEPSDPFPQMVNQIWVQLPNISSIKGGCRIIENPVFNKETYSVELDGERFFLGKTVFNLLKKAESLALFACTAGEGIANASKKLMDNGDFMEGYIADTAGSVIVEKAMDLIQNKLKESVRISGKFITNRYSPGYCDWSVKEQHKLFSFLPPTFCGITLTDSSLMQPIKSVSGMIGIGSNVKYNEYTCNICSSSHCLYRKK